MTMALSIVESILRSDRSDLIGLAEIAGLDPRLMYLNADLSGVDLKNQDISFLVGLNTKFEAAVLTDQQRNLLRKGRSEERRQQRRKSIRDVRVELITEFLEQFPSDSLQKMRYKDVMIFRTIKVTQRTVVNISPEMLKELVEAPSDANISPPELRALLLDPIVDSTSSNPNDQFGSDYMSAALANLAIYAIDENLPFFERLFTLFGVLQCPVDGIVVKVLTEYYLPALKHQVGLLLSCMRPTHDLDTWWVVEMAPEDEQKSHAIQISQRRHVHPAAVDTFVARSPNLDEKIDFLTEVKFNVDADLAERLALYIVKDDWPPWQTDFVLNAKLPPRVGSSVLRQLLAQGNERRILNVLTWLNDNRGAVGALSLENAIASITNFDLVHQLAVRFAPQMKANQLKVIDDALSRLAYRNQDQARLQKFRTMVGIPVPTRPR